MLRFRSRVLRFRVLGASFSRFGCFVLRSSFSSASFSKLPAKHVVSKARGSWVIEPCKMLAGKKAQMDFCRRSGTCRVCGFCQNGSRVLA